MKAIIAALIILLISAMASPAFAGIDRSFDWDGNKRTLKVWYNFNQATDKLGDTLLKDIMDDATANWNAVKADTGWEFQTGGTAADHDIEIKVGELGESGGAVTTGFPADGDKDRTVSELTITFDKTPKEGFEWDAAGKDKDKTKNPVSGAMHELSHTIRLDHQGGTRSVSTKIKDPQGKETKNDDVTTVSADDKTEAKTASTAPIKVASAPAGPGTGVFLAISGFPEDIPIYPVPPEATLSISASAFLNDVVVTFSRTSLYSMPEPFSTPLGIDRIVKGVHIDVAGVSAPPELDPDSLFTITIPYEDGVEGEPFLIDIADPQFTPIVETNLRPFIYDPASQIWWSIDPLALGGSYSLDTTDDLAEITLPSDLLYEFPNPGDSLTGTLFISIAGPPVAAGGIAELPDISHSSGPNYTTLAGLAAAALVALTAGAWYARRRWLG